MSDLNELLVTSLEDATRSLKKSEKTIKELSEENSFLSKTILAKKEGTVASERRSIKKREMMCVIKENRVKKAISEYNKKTTDADERLADIKSKQDNINAFIVCEAEKKIHRIRQNYKKKIKAAEEQLEKHKAENDKILQDKLNYYKKVHA